MNEQPTHDSVLAELVALMKDPATLSKKITDLGVATKAHQVAIAAAKAEQDKLNDLRETVGAGVAELRTQAAQKIREAEAAHDKRVAAREVELSAREQRATELEAKAVDHEAKAKAIRTAIEKKQKAWDAA